MRKIAKILAFVGLILINIGLVLTCVDLRKECENYYAELLEKTDAYEELELRLYAEIDERLRLQYQNENLWDLYYSQVSDYAGEYEYYE